MIDPQGTHYYIMESFEVGFDLNYFGFSKKYNRNLENNKTISLIYC